MRLRPGLRNLNQLGIDCAIFFEYRSKETSLLYFGGYLMADAACRLPVGNDVYDLAQDTWITCNNLTRDPSSRSHWVGAVASSEPRPVHQTIGPYERCQVLKAPLIWGGVTSEATA